MGDLDLVDLSNEIENLAASFVHGDITLKDGGDLENDSDWIDDGQLSWMIVELDTDTKTARVVPNVEASVNDYNSGVM
jgi:hypothetical protein